MQVQIRCLAMETLPEGELTQAASSCINGELTEQGHGQDQDRALGEEGG